MKTENIDLIFSKSAIKEIAKFAYILNEQQENIGVRRFHIVIKKLLEDILFNASDLKEIEIVVDDEYVNRKLMNDIQQKDITKYIL